MPKEDIFFRGRKRVDDLESFPGAGEGRAYATDSLSPGVY